MLQSPLSIRAVLLPLVALAIASPSYPAPAPVKPTPAESEVAALKQLYSMLKKDHMISDPRLQFAVYVKDVRSGKLLDVLLKRKNAKGNVEVVFQAREAKLAVNAKKGLLIITMCEGTGIGSDHTKAWFDCRREELPLPASFFKK